MATATKPTPAPDPRLCWKSPTTRHARDGDGFCTWCGAIVDATGAAKDSDDPAQLDILGGDAA
jgi:hypothetical protein